MKPRYALIVGLVLIYIMACALPAQSTKPMAGSPGIAYLALPFLLFPYGFLVPFWWANPLFFGGCLALGAGKDRLATSLGVVASLLALTYNGMAGFGGMLGGSALWMTSMFGLAAARFFLPDGRVEGAKPGPMGEL